MNKKEIQSKINELEKEIGKYKHDLTKLEIKDEEVIFETFKKDPEYLSLKQDIKVFFKSLEKVPISITVGIYPWDLDCFIEKKGDLWGDVWTFDLVEKAVKSQHLKTAQKLNKRLQTLAKKYEDIDIDVQYTIFNKTP